MFKTKKADLLLSTMLLLTATLFTGVLQAGDKPAAGKKSTNKLIFPDVQGKYCVIKDTLQMRKHHMKYIKHRRAETTRKGMRWKREKHFNNFSFDKCISCHARNKQGKKVKLKIGGKLNPKHFCVSCHRYTAVTIDCFNCHRGTPSGKVRIISKPDTK